MRKDDPQVVAARAVDGLATGLRRTDPSQARHYWVRCLTIRRDMGIPEAATVVYQLAELGADKPRGGPRLSATRRTMRQSDDHWVRMGV